MNKFLKKSELQLVNGGYLSDADSNPVFNQQFVDLQKKAEWVVTFSIVAATKDFKGKQADSLGSVTNEVEKLLAKKQTSFVDLENKIPVGKITNSLKEEALAWMNYQEKSTSVEKINKFMQQFEKLQEFEEFGLFFNDSEIVKLNKIYTVTEIVEAVKSCIELL